MEISHIILAKEKGDVLTDFEIDFIVKNFTNGTISKEDMTKFLLLVFRKGLSVEETYALTRAMLKSGKIIDLSELGDTVDKHSTGGVSDSTTLIVVPIFALLGLECLKMSGGALGHTGGTADKIKVFEGLRNKFTTEQALKIIKEHGACFIVASDDLAPADRVIYNLRDEIGAINSIPLIASSIMSKKLACGAQTIVLDVKYGNGAIIKSKPEAEKLAQLMFKIGTLYGRKMCYLLGDMNQPLGQCVGNVMEVLEVIETLKFAPRTPLLEHSLAIVVKATATSGKMSEDEAYKTALELVTSGKALKKLKEIIKAQGGSLELFERKFAPDIIINSMSEGKITNISTERLGLNNRALSRYLNYKGFKILKRLGDNVKIGEPLVEIYSESIFKGYRDVFLNCFRIEK